MKKITDGFLKVDDLHKIYWAEYGDPNGEPILMFHGGPGSQFKKKHTRGKEKFRVIVFDQRGCGRSTPRGELKQNTTQNILKDVDKLLDFRGVDKKVTLVGGSWGSTLPLLYAQYNSARVKAIFVSAIFLGRKEDEDWIYYGSSAVYPDYHNKMLGFIPESHKNNIPVYLLDRIENGTQAEKEQAAQAVASYEYALMFMKPSNEDFTSDEVSENDICDMRIYLNYSINDFFLKDEDSILNNLSKIQHIPVTIVHGRHDMCCRLEGAYSLHKGLKKSKLIIVDAENHKSKKVNTILTEEINKNA